MYTLAVFAALLAVTAAASYGYEPKKEYDVAKSYASVYHVSHSVPIKVPVVYKEHKYEAPKYEHKYEAPKYEHKYEAPKYEHKYEAPKYENKYEAPKYEHKYEAPKYEHKYEAPKYEYKHEEPKYEIKYEHEHKYEPKYHY